jgi:transcriptional regulator with XRE-family HTH domain
MNFVPVMILVAGIQMVEIAKKCGVTKGNVSAVVSRRGVSERVEREIAKLLDVPVEQVFPDRAAIASSAPDQKRTKSQKDSAKPGQGKSKAPRSAFRELLSESEALELARAVHPQLSEAELAPVVSAMRFVRR